MQHEPWTQMTKDYGNGGALTLAIPAGYDVLSTTS